MSDKKIGILSTSNPAIIDHYEADVVSASDYYPFGMQMPGRNFSVGSYRYGFNGAEMDNDIKGEGNSIDFGARIYDPRISRWLSVDAYANKYPNVTPYAFCLNSPLQFKEANGHWLVDKNGNIIWTSDVSTIHTNDGYVYQVIRHFFYTNDGKEVETGFYLYRGRPEDAIWEDEENKKGWLKWKDETKLFSYPNSGNPESSNCHGNTLNGKGELWGKGIDIYIPGRKTENNEDNVSQIFKNSAEFTPVKAEEVKPGDVAIFESDDGALNHSATVTKVGKNGKVLLTSKNDRDKVQRNQTIQDIQNTKWGKTELLLYKNFAGYYRKNPNKQLDIETNVDGFTGYAGSRGEEKITKILDDVKKKKE